MPIRRALVAAPVLVAVLAGPAAAQGFDCTKARYDAERAVCASTYLSSLDEELNTVFYSLPRHVRESDEVGAERRAFLIRRNACGWNENCIASHYSAFLNLLRRL